MAVLSPQELVEIRKKAAARVNMVPWNKFHINAALQTIEDWFSAHKADLAADIEAATSVLGYSFTGPQKKFLVAMWLFQKAGKEIL